jgi:1,4-alpha-glucan branching enzyme
MSAIFSLMLHAHIPYCRKSGVWPAGEEWLFEAMHETYIPLLSMLRRFQQQNQRPRIMIGIVPILAEQLADPYMNERFCGYMEDKIRRSEWDMNRFDTNPAQKAVASYYRDYYIQSFEAYKHHFFRNLLGTFKWLQEEKVIELLTSGATHGFLPLMECDSAIFSQIQLGVQTYEKYFGCKPRGIWLPECAYRPRQGNRRGIDEWLADAGLQYFFVEDVGITGAEWVANKHNETVPSTYRGYKLESGVCVFGRNSATGKQVWSPHDGYPGDPRYREFHQKDAETGLQYWRITGKNEKELYNPMDARAAIESHADHFVKLLQKLGQENVRKNTDTLPLIVSPYDCELYGHWWHEGVNWIDAVYTRLLTQSDLRIQTLEEVIHESAESFSTIRMKPSTWGLNSDFTVWQNNEHGWIWPYINGSCKDLEQVLANLWKSGRNWNDRDLRIMRQLGRELLLMEGSDWPFLLYTEQAKEYANQRFHNHHQRFNKLLWAAKNLDDSRRISDEDLWAFENIDNPFPDLDLRLFAKK